MEVFTKQLQFIFLDKDAWMLVSPRMSITTLLAFDAGLVGITSNPAESDSNQL
jgi:hypothetical protein